jgi:hypothetical protein
MCANGVNTEQYKQMIDYMDDTLAVNRRWIHKMAHTVEDNGYAKTSEVMHQVQALLNMLWTNSKRATLPVGPLSKSWVAPAVA